MHFKTFSLIELFFLHFFIYLFYIVEPVIIVKYFSYGESVSWNLSRCEHTVQRCLFSATRRECFQETEKGNSEPKPFE